MVLNRRALLQRAAGAAAGATMLGRAGAALAATAHVPLWKTALRRGIVYGSSAATWQFDPEYRRLLAREAAMLFTEDDLLWYRLKPTPQSPLDFSYGDQFVRFAESHDQLLFL